MLHSIAVQLNRFGHQVENFLLPQWVLIHKYLIGVFGNNEELLKYSVGALGFLVFIGTLLGVKKKIKVYTNANDVFTTFFTIVFPVAGFFFAAYTGMHTSRATFIVCKWIVYTTEAIVVASVFWHTWRANRSVWKTVPALITKYTLSALLLINLFILFTGTSKSKDKYAAGEAPLIDGSVIRGLMAVGFFAGIIYSLIDDTQTEEVKAESVDKAEWEAIKALKEAA